TDVEITQIRRAGQARNAPPRFQPQEKSKKSSFKADLTKPLPERMAEGLKALIDEIRKTGRGLNRIQLFGGKPYSIDGHLDCYRFLFESDHELYEGLLVTAGFGEHRLPGKILAASGTEVFIQFSGSEIKPNQNCVIEIDNTSLLESLKTALDDVSAKKIANFGEKLAGNVIKGKSDTTINRKSDVPLSPDLNQSQKQAIINALEKQVSYIWGPPGTGKTLALGELVRVLYEQGEKILVCSNTNQAVDQLLLKLCEVLGRSHPAMQSGHVVRIGKIDHE
ncbi:MAG: AAA domain-containing protein, partial [Gammaproteobacteria bacterium]